MAYQTYTTDAIVCGSRHLYTADRSYLLFTRELGMLWATARSVREERSRQRYALQDFSLIRVSLVKGKGGWRVGSTEALGNPFLAAEARSARAGIAYVVRQLRRYIHGEQPIPIAYDDVAATLTAVASLADPLTIAPWQQVCLVRLLYALGYVGEQPVLRPLFTASSVSTAVDAFVPAMEGAIVRAHQAAKEVSHL